ncbi:hypothetical protein Q0601_09830 [Paracoccus onubensis]|uniref:hypothetical protein n=1 Tax=Paracoccus onubensis TaxID=1675788 RepID=UPI0027306C20|nr:hypothetical protein [Paracoccus onubensis]MDP0927469.1 hypothetical protein [Paracoccus onubensis]
MAESLRHPGPADGPRLMLSGTRMEERVATLAAGIPLETAIAEALNGADSAWISFADGHGDLRFVLPDRATDGLHGAWYSTPRDAADTPLHRAGIVWGRREGRAFGHCHGLWGETMGHLLLDASRLTRPVQARAMLFPDARFIASEDAETAFTLFKPEGGVNGYADAALLRLAPHVDLCDGIVEAVRKLGWSRAQVEGIGSLNTARFADGTLLDSHASEFLISNGIATDTEAEIAIDIVGIGGIRAAGLLKSGANPVCVTAEIILLRET